jgi:hypothetical protein
MASAALAASPATVKRCGYAHSKFAGAVALYPWHMTCGATRRTLRQSEAKHLQTIQFSADGNYTFDGGAVKLAGKWWVCGGRMGFYFCGYPYRPARAPGVGGGTTCKGPFTKEFIDEACTDSSYLCKRRVRIFQPPVKS